MIGLGTMSFFWTTTEQEAYRILDEYCYLGGSVVDTADMYPNWVEGFVGGETESFVGKWLQKSGRREDIFLTTKVRPPFTEKNIRRSLEMSLRRLRTSYVDVYFAHWSDPETPIEETLSAFQLLMNEGKIRSLGCSNYSKEALEHALIVGENMGMQYSYLQAYYNLIARKTYEEQLLPLVKRYGLQVMPYGSLAGGLLSGAYSNNEPLPTHARAKFVKENLTKKNAAIVAYVTQLSEKYHVSVAQLVLSWLCLREFIRTPLIGADSAGQVRENFLRVAIAFTKKELADLDKLTG